MLKYTWIVLFFLGLFWSCKPQEEILASGATTVRFSADTMLFDTVFSTVGTLTLRLKVYNDNSNAIKIGSVTVGGGSDSPFKVIVNGLETSVAKDVLLLGKDSLYVLVKVLIDPKNQNLPYLVTDSILFSSNGSTQIVRLVAWGQDATFLQNQTISANTIWDAQKPYVVYGNITIDSLSTLTIKEGVRVFFGAKGAMVVKGKLNVTGTSYKPVVFTSADLNKQKGVHPGQWEGIQFSNHSTGNTLSWTVIENASTGISLLKNEVPSSPDVNISHSIIKNMTSYGILCQSGSVNLNNSLVSNCAKNTVRVIAGGKGIWVNNTFVNYSFDFFREGPVLYLSDNDNNTNVKNLTLQLTNNVVWGSFTNEITLSGNTTSGTFLVLGENNVLKTAQNGFWDSSNFIYDFAANRRLRTDTIHFVDEYLYDFRPDSISFLRQRAKIYPGITDGNDLDGKPRDVLPDIGAYEYRKN